jgi:O-antigen ligase
MIGWLLYMSNSATSIFSLVVAVAILAIGSRPSMVSNPQKIFRFGIASVVLFGVLEFVFSIKDSIIILLGRRPDLTTRVPMWEDLLSMVKNPIIGFGYESFWLGGRLQYMIEHWGIDCHAHNGYLEMYLNLGIVGLVFILLWIVSGLKNVNRHLASDYPAAMLRLCFIVVVILYNYTEATFFGPSTLWMLFFIGVMYIPEKRPL